MKIRFCLFLTIVSLVTALPVEAITPAMPDLAIEKTTQRSPTFWIVTVKNIGQLDSEPTTLKVIATRGETHSCRVAAIKAGRTVYVACKTPFASQKDMSCEFVLNPDKTMAEASYENNRMTTLTDPKFN